MVPIPKFPLSSSLMYSERDPIVFLVEKVKTDVGDVVATLVRIDAIRLVEVAAPEASSRLKSSPAPIPANAEEEAKCLILKGSTMALRLVSTMVAVNTLVLAWLVEVENKVKEEIPSENNPPCPIFNEFACKLFPTMRLSLI